MKLFVYGTLKGAFWNNRYLQTSKFIEHKVVSGFKLHSLSSRVHGIPGMVPGEAEDKVFGEVYEVTDSGVLAAIDQLESHPYGYCRTELSAEEDLWGYIYQHPVGIECDKNSRGEYEWDSE